MSPGAQSLTESSSAAQPQVTGSQMAASSHRTLIRPTMATKPAAATTPQEVLVIASRLKDYIQARGDMNTSASVMDILSDHLRLLCNEAIDHARSEGRKTVMDRDFEAILKN